MFAKLIGSVLLVAFCFVQLGSSLDCFFCDSQAACTSPRSVTCSRAVANETTDHLHKFFNTNLTSAVSDNFDCFRHHYNSSAPSLSNITYRGCIYRSIQVCSLPLKTEYQQFQQKECNKCSGNLCNPAGTFSSSLVAMATSILAVCLYKLL